jgi:hypothetical protein
MQVIEIEALEDVFDLTCVPDKPRDRWRTMRDTRGEGLGAAFERDGFNL